MRCILCCCCCCFWCTKVHRLIRAEGGRVRLLAGWHGAFLNQFSSLPARKGRNISGNSVQRMDSKKNVQNYYYHKQVNGFALTFGHVYYNPQIAGGGGGGASSKSRFGSTEAFYWVHTIFASRALQCEWQRGSQLVLGTTNQQNQPASTAPISHM